MHHKTVETAFPGDNVGVNVKAIPKDKRPLGGDVDMNRQGPRPTFLTLRDHGKVYVAELPNLSDGQLAHIYKEVEEVLLSLERRINDLQQETGNGLKDPECAISNNKAVFHKDLEPDFKNIASTMGFQTK